MELHDGALTITDGELVIGFFNPDMQASRPCDKVVLLRDDPEEIRELLLSVCRNWSSNRLQGRYGDAVEALRDYIDLKDVPLFDDDDEEVT